MKKIKMTCPIHGEKLQLDKRAEIWVCKSCYTLAVERREAFERGRLIRDSRR